MSIEEHESWRLEQTQLMKMQKEKHISDVKLFEKIGNAIMSKMSVEYHNYWLMEQTKKMNIQKGNWVSDIKKFEKIDRDISTYLMYTKRIYDRYNDLLKSGKNPEDMTNNDLCKIFEYYCAMMLTIRYGKQYYEYDDIDPSYKENNNMTQNDTGIDLCDMKSSVVQCKLRKQYLNWTDVATFFGSQIGFDKQTKQRKFLWEHVIIARNSECKISGALKTKPDLFTDVIFPRETIISFCDNLIKHPPIRKETKKEKFILRDYQIEAVNLIKSSTKNVIINIATGGGKSVIIVSSMEANKKYLILVPRIILMEQIKSIILQNHPEWTSIQMIGDNNNVYNANKLITICIYNSVNIVAEHKNVFEKIYVDEAHHINPASIYKDEGINNNEDNTYIDTIKSFAELNNNIYLSATIDRQYGFDFYQKKIRDMINEGYLSDYLIKVPVFSSDPANTNICKYLIKMHRNIIVYCNTINEGIKLTKKFNELRKGCCEFISCKTPRKKRVAILKKYNEGKLEFLVNVSILTEGFDSALTRGVMFMHMPSSNTKLIQIIGRCLRLHKDKKYAQIILPYSIDDDISSITKFLKIMAKNDIGIRKAYETKKLGGYISIDKIDEDHNNQKNAKLIEFRCEQVYSNFGKLCESGETYWFNMLDQLKKFINIRKRIPNSESKNIEERRLGRWCKRQQTIYRLKKDIMSLQHCNIRNIWYNFVNNEYKCHFVSSVKKWKNKLNELQTYINTYKKLPLRSKKNKYQLQLAMWLYAQQENYTKKRYIMKNPLILRHWEYFIKLNKQYFISNDNIWRKKKNLFQEYCDKYGKRPSADSKIKSVAVLGEWFSSQQKSSKNRSGIMKYEHIYNEWRVFLSQYAKYFRTDVEIWMRNLKQTKLYILKNNKLPPKRSNDEETRRLHVWITSQKFNHKKQRGIVTTDSHIKATWEEFITSYRFSKYFNICDLLETRLRHIAPVLMAKNRV